MTFSLSAEGSRDQVLSSVRKQAVQQSDPGAMHVHDALGNLLDGAPENHHDGRRIRYHVSASGHHNPGGGMPPSLSLTLSSSTEPDGE